MFNTAAQYLFFFAAKPTSFRLKFYIVYVGVG